jgi:hypothetical protein
MVVIGSKPEFLVRPNAAVDFAQRNPLDQNIGKS